MIFVIFRREKNELAILLDLINVDHSILIAKLKRYSFSTNSLALIKNYLSNRYTISKLKDCFSNKRLNEEENDDDEAALAEDQDTESITSVDNLDDYNLITPIKSNKIINQKDELSLDDLKNAVNKLNNLEQNQLESVEGTQEQKNEYEKQKQLIINSIQFSIKNVII